VAQIAHLKALVYGRVQGVFLRYFVRDTARNLGLNGCVRNLPRRDIVEVQAEGDKRQLEKLIQQLKIGPPGAQVKKVEVNWSDYSGQFSTFSISY